MVSKEQALTEQAFHLRTPNHQKCYRFRRNGKTQTWVRSPERFRVPVKYGLYEYDQITEFNADLFHAESECPYGYQ